MARGKAQNRKRAPAIALEPLLTEESERVAEFRLRRSEHVSESIHPADLDKYVADGWELERAGTTKTRVRKPKSLDRRLANVLEARLSLKRQLRQRNFGTILADPPWQFTNRTGKMAPEHKRLSRYSTMTTDEICALPIGDYGADVSHLYLWVPNALLPQGLQVLSAWGFNYKSNIVWYKTRKDGGPDGRGVGFYFRNVTELLLFGVKGKNARTREAGRRQVNIIPSR